MAVVALPLKQEMASPERRKQGKTVAMSRQGVTGKIVIFISILQFKYQKIITKNYLEVEKKK